VDKEPNPHALLRLPQVLALVPVSKSTWWLGVKTGRFPPPVKLGDRITCWRGSDILALIQRAAGGGSD
jgi:prophage regulatory protein